MQPRKYWTNFRFIGTLNLVAKSSKLANLGIIQLNIIFQKQIITRNLGQDGSCITCARCAIWRPKFVIKYLKSFDNDNPVIKQLNSGYKTTRLYSLECQNLEVMWVHVRSARLRRGSVTATIYHPPS